MKKTVNIWQRLLAFALAFVMVLSYVPVDVVAEEPEIDLSAFSVSVKVTTTAAENKTTEIIEEVETEVITYEIQKHDFAVTMPEGVSVSGIADGDTTTSSDAVTATFTTADGKVLKMTIDPPDEVTQITTETTVTGTWKCDIEEWGTVKAGSTISIPKLTLSEGASFEKGEVKVEALDAAGNAVNNGDVATVAMGELTATYTVDDVVIATKKSSAVGYAPITNVTVSPVAGWYAELPAEVTVTAESTAVSTADLEKIADAEWTKNEEGKYTLTFAPVDGTAYTIAGMAYTWNEDNVDPWVSVIKAYVTNDNKTAAVYDYAVGASGGTITFTNGVTKAVTGSGSGCIITFDEILESVGASIKNNLTENPKEDTSTPKNVTPLPSISYTGFISEIGDQIFVHNETYLTFTINNAESATWDVEGSTPGKTVKVKAADYAGSKLVVNATDDMGRVVARETKLIVLDTQKPVITITPPDANDPTDGECKYFPTNRTYTIKVEDNTGDVGIHSHTAKAIINGTEVPVTFSGHTATVEVKNGETLTAISVEAKDVAGNVETNTFETNVHVDTVDPVISGSLSVAYADGTPGKIASLYKVGTDIFLVLDEGANNEKDDEGNDRDDKVTVTLTYTLTEANDNGKNGWDNGTITRTVVVEENKHGVLDLSVAAKDLAGRSANNTIVLVEDVISLQAVDGKYDMTLIIDRRPPENDTNDALTNAPDVTLSVDGNSTKIGDIRYFKGDFNFGMKIHDLSSGLAEEDGEDPIRKANIVVETKGSGFSYPSQTVKPDNNGEASIKINVTENKEFEDGMITLKIYDNVGNYYFYREAFAVDSEAPRVTASIEREKDDASADIDFYNSAVTLTFNMKDQVNANATILATIDKNGTVRTDKLTLTGKEASTSITLQAGEKLTALKYYAEDALGNAVGSAEAPVAVFSTGLEDYSAGYQLVRPIEVDGTPAEVQISRSDVPVKTVDGVDYYNKEVEIAVSVSDKNIDNTDGTAILYYTIDNGTEVEQEISLENNKGSVKFTVAGDTALTGLRVQVQDNAGNVTTKFYGDVPGTAAEGILTYTGNSIAVDVTDPVVKVERTLENAEYFQTVGGKAYYKEAEAGKAKVTYTVTITDKFLDSIASQATINGNAATFTKGEGTLAALDTLTVSYTIEDKDGGPLTAMDFTVEDMVDHVTKLEDIDKTTTAPDDITFIQDGNKFTYTGTTVIVDDTAPEASLVVAGDVSTLVRKDDTYYIRLNNNVTDENVGNQKDKESVTLTMTVKDRNLTLTESAGLDAHIAGTGWTMNGDNTVATYVDSTLEAALHHSDETAIEVAAYDMAGHPITLNLIKIGEETSYSEYTLNPGYEGDVKVGFVLDRRSPSTADTDAPQITLDDGDAEPVKVDGKPDLYGPNGFSFALTVLDTYKDEAYAGLKEVSWTLDGAGIVVNGSGSKPANEQHDPKFQDSIAVSGQGETDDAKITVTASDMVDNSISYVHQFAYDNLAPRVTVKFTGDSVRDNQYFNHDRTATVTVEDLHLPALADIGNYIKITTQGQAGSWSIDGTTATITYSFTKDGEYTFQVDYAKDLCMNTTEDAAVTYEGDITRENGVVTFVIDKTNPVINAQYDPNKPFGYDEKNVAYYAEDVTANITITEKNFDAKDVQANFDRGGLALSRWSDGEDHKASVTFPEGNDYAFTIDFVDLAGNKATTYKSHTFTVDTHAPTIEITRGNLTNKELNIVEDDLVLGFTINDEQKNLDDYNVSVVKLGNDFQKVEVDFYSIVVEEERTTVRVNFDSIAKEKLNDGVYTIEITAKDYAGNTVNLNPDLIFSLNRFGSTFMTDDEYTLEFLAVGEDGNAYHRDITDKLIIHEINPNKVWNDSSKKVEGSTLTAVVNGTSTVLEEGKDYTMTVTEQGSVNTKFYVYTYEIDPSAFKNDDKLVDGRYSVLIYGEDEAGNKNTNESNVSGKLQKDAEGQYNGKIEFILDSTAPIISTAGIESGKNYNAEAQKLEIFLSDNTPSSIKVYLNDNEVVLTEQLADTASWLAYNESSDSYTLNVPEMNTLFAGQKIRIAVTDAAGNEAELDIEDFSVSTNMFVRLLNSTWFIISVIALAVLLAAAVVLNLKKRKVHAA